MTEKARKVIIAAGVLVVAVVVAAIGGWATAQWQVERQIQKELRRREALEEQWRRDAAPVPGRAAFVSAVDLITSPERYSDTRVILAGVWKVGFEHSELDLENVAQNFWIWVEPDWTSVNQPMGDLSHRKQKDEQASPDRNGHAAFRIVAEGTFRFRRENDPPDINGFGHMGVSEGYFLFDRLFQFENVDPAEPNQPPQRNAGSRPSSDDSPVSETPSSRGPRG